VREVREMSNLKGTRTEKNLLSAFVGESQARNRYTYFASQARKEGYQQIASFFLEAADNEREHAKTFFTFLQGGEVEITGSFPAGIIGKTHENLKVAVTGEADEHTTVYPEFARIAEEENFPEVAVVFRAIALVEEYHGRRYRRLAENIEKGRVFTREEKVEWKCRNCGYVHTSREAPKKCPSCSHSRAFFELLAENY